ncbi:MAG: hypothetical protein ACO3WI_05200, partial [Ilumatobacteraceae bacterium]
MTSSIRTRRRPGVLIGAVAIAFGLVAAACGGDDGGSSENSNTTVGSSSSGSTDSSDNSEPTDTEAPSSEPVFGGVLRVGLEADVDGLNPAASALAVSGLT